MAAGEGGTGTRLAPPAQPPPTHSNAVDYTFKYIIIGESAAGKSSLLQQFINGRLSEIAKHTVGVEFGSRTVVVAAEDASGGSGSSAVVKLQIWDTAGQDRFRSVTRSYYRGAVGALVVFSLADRASYDAVPRWLADARAYAGDGVTIVLVGNKADLVDSRQVTMLEASALAQTEGVAYIETSAVTGDNVEAVFFKLSRAVLLKIGDGVLDASKLATGRPPAGGLAVGGAGAGTAAPDGAGGSSGGGCAC